ncbi:hypothetical protein PU560_12560 [Georgenia sp. 10Sc9-8]|uniref:Aldose 1-epimerase n=1 Tax=Georgenia halotolerans TaxID=3028317 RepID=A0ABT5TYZ8_9MICO|nr:hypothetical protein [Georgenia halotolerans]
MALETHDLEGIPTWVLTDADGARLQVSSRGAMVLSWQVPDDEGRMVELLDGYTTATELLEHDGYRNAVLVPWSNRVRDARYTWQGVERDLAPGGTEDVMHGLVVDATWQEVAGGGDVTEPDESDTDCVSLVTAIEPSPGYPFPLQVRATYRLTSEDGTYRLSLDLTAFNTGAEDAPVALGWHPYVRLPGHGSIDELDLRVPAGTQIRTDDASIPLPGQDAFVPATGSETMAPLGDQVLDDAWTDLEPDGDGTVRTVLSSRRTGSSITLEQHPSARVVHVFTGDTLQRDRRAAVALEPCQLMTDAVNRPECAEALALPPGDTRRLSATLVHRP